MNSIDNTLAERGKRYGEFAGHAKITQDIKSLFTAQPKWSVLADDQKEALEMIAHKIGRIFNGDPNYDDSWIDIAGYAKLVADRLTAEQKPGKSMAGTVGAAMQSARDMRNAGTAAALGSVLVGGAKSKGWDHNAAAKTQARNPGEECQCLSCTMNRLLAGAKTKGLTMDEIEALFPGLNIVIVTDSDEQT